ncbi:MAG: hypothetical protein ACJ76Z_12985 [Thermoleophilaceae bacterium]
MTAAPLGAGVALSVLGGIVRVRAWERAAADACPAAGVRYRDVVLAHLAGAGFNGLIPAHGGDGVKLALLKRRCGRVPLGLLLGSLGPPAAVEALLTSLLLVWALSTGLLDTPSSGQIPLPLVGAAAALAAFLLWIFARRAPRLLRDVRRGLAPLRRPRLMLAHVAPWVVAARMLRLGAIACFVAAVGLPVTLIAVLLVMAVQGGVGSLGPATTPMRIGVLSAALPAAVGLPHVSGAAATALIAGTQLAVMAANLTISVVVLALTLRTTSPRRVAAYCREAAATARAAQVAQPAAPVTKP